MLSEKFITKFQKIYYKNFNEEISEEKALKEGLHIIRIISTINKIPIIK